MAQDWSTGLLSPSDSEQSTAITTRLGPLHTFKAPQYIQLLASGTSLPLSPTRSTDK